jgi:hypothetical protein
VLLRHSISPEGGLVWRGRRRKVKTKDLKEEDKKKRRKREEKERERRKKKEERRKKKTNK